MQFEDFTAIENLLKRYKELEEENKNLTESLKRELEINTEYQKELYSQKIINSTQFIPISVIQNKIKDEQDKILYFEQISETANAMLHYRRQQVLQELLEGE